MRNAFSTHWVLGAFSRLFKLIAIFLSVVLTVEVVHAGCGANQRTWDKGGSDRNWNTDANWTSDDHPSDSTYEAIVVSASQGPRINLDVTVGCVEVQSGLLAGQSNRTLTIAGDYFRALTTSSTSLNQTGFVLEMAGSAAQTLELKDRVRSVHINNDTSVTFTEEFEVTTDLTFEAGWSGTLYINKDVLLSLNTDVTIPADGTVVIGNGVVVEIYQNLTVDGTLRLLPGAKLKMNNGRTLSVSSGGLLKLEGASGNIATLTTRDGGDDFNFNVIGSINAEYFRIERLNAAGMNVTGTIQKLDHGEFHYLDNNGYAVTLGGSATVPSTLDDVGFFNDDGVGTVSNFNASSYDVSDFTLTNWSGSVGGETNDNDPNNRVDWSTPAATTLTITDDSDGNAPPNTINQSTTAEFGTIAFALSAADTSTDITQIVVTMIGSASSSDIEWVEVWRDASGSRNCNLDTGADVNMTGQTTLSGSPPKVTVNVTAGDISTASDLDRYCIHLRAQTTASAQDDKRIQFSIEATGDVTNSESYSFSASSGPPLRMGESRINGDTRRIWEGANNTNYSQGNNWSGNTAPTSATDCQIGLGTNNPIVDASPSNCQNATLPANGILNFNSTTNEFRIFGNLEVASGYTFQNAGTGVIAMRGTNNQGLKLETLFPGKLIIGNTGTAPNNVVSVNANSSVTGDLDVDAGVLRIVSPNTLTVSGDVTVKSGTTLEIEPGATLELASGSTLDIQSGATFKLVGSSSLDATVSSTGGGAYTVDVSGTIEARYYSFENLGTTGVTINSGATIDSTNYMQDGRFSNPVNSNTTLLNLNRTIPGHSLTDMTFESGGSSATNVTNVSTSGVSTSGTLVFDGYTGDLAGISYHNEGANYLISWTGATNTIKISQKTAAPGSVDAGQTVNVGQFAFQQSLAGSSFENAEITSLKITLDGNGSTADVDAVRIYYDSDCSNSGGTLIGTGSFTGVPETVTFTPSAGAAVVPADLTSPAERCIYVEYDISTAATGGKTVGAKIAASNDFANDQSYGLAGSTPAPITLGTASVVGASLTSWTGTTSTAWATASNWSAGVPDSTKTCQIDSAGNNPTIAAGTTGICKSVTIGNGTLTLADSTASLDVHGNFSNTGTFTQNSGTLAFKDGGASTEHVITSSSTIDEIDIAKTGGGNVQIGSNNLTITTVTLVSSPTFTLLVPSGKTLTLPNGLSYSSGTLEVQGGGTLKIGDGNSLTVNSGATLKLVGASGNTARLTSQSSTTGYDVTVNGTINAQYYTFDRMNANGLTIGSGATINATNNLTNGEFKYPLANNGTFLTLNKELPGDSIGGMVFDLDGASATGTDNIDTTGITGGSDTLTITSYSGDVSGPADENTTGSSYTITWQGAENTYLVTQNNTQSGSMNAGSTYTMGRFGFQQKLAGGSYPDMDITSIKLTMTGTATASDIFDVKLYYDSNCDSAGGVLIASGSLSGSPASRTFALSAGELTVPSHASSPPVRCIYVTYEIDNSATDGVTAGVKISSGSHLSNDQSWNIDASVSFPVDLGTARSIVGATSTTWDGSSSTDWHTAANWSSGVPDSTKDCVITNQANDPVISSSDAACSSVTISSGASLTLNSGRTLDAYGDFSNSGTFTHNGTLRFSDGGAGSSHTLSSATSLNTVTFSKTSGGVVQTSGASLTINTLTIPGGSSFEFLVSNGNVLTLPNGFSLPAGTFNVAGGGTVKVGASQTITVSGGTFKTSGTNDAYPQTTTNKALLTVNGAGRWAFSATSGTLNFVGFLLDKLDANGLQVGGTANLQRFDGGQFINLSTSYPVKALNLTTSTAVSETSPTNVGFYWDAANTLYDDSCCNPTTSDTFYLVYGSNCGNQLIAFDQWFGDFVEDPVNYAIEDKLYDDADGGSCQVTMNGGDSAVDLISFVASPYDEAVVLNWVTGQESNHAGFNVYRSLHPTSGYVQINNDLIRNLSGSASGHGSYRFDDQNVTNGTAYYYMIQDVEWSGVSKLHGPVTATPEGSLGGVPTVDPGENYGNSPDSDAGDGSLLDLGGGVKIVAQTNNSFRLSIEPPAATYQASSWDGSYYEVDIEGYSKTLTSGHPETVQKTVLIEVKGSFATVTSTEVQVQEAPIESYKIVPAPSWIPDGSGGLQASYSVDSGAYASTEFLPSSFYSVDPEIVEIAGKSFVRIVVSPVRFNASTDQTQKANRILLDIGLDGQAWEVSPPSGSVQISAAAMDGNLRLGYKKSGFYQLSYDDLVAGQVEGPFAGVDVTQLRLYSGDQEVPLEIDSSTGLFSSGDTLRFYLDFEKSVDDSEDEVVLSQFDVYSSGESPLRVGTAEVGPSGYHAGSSTHTTRTVTAEMDLDLRMEPPVGDFSERLFWKWIYGPSGPAFDLPVEMANLDPGVSDPVAIRLWVNGFSRQIENPTFHIGLHVNSNPSQLADASYQSNETTVLEFEIAASEFVDGLNTIKVQELGDLVPAGVYNLVYIDKIEVTYQANKSPANGVADILNTDFNKTIQITGFDEATPFFYDVSYPSSVYRLTDVQMTANGSFWDAELAAVWGIHGHSGYGRRILGIESDAFLSPTSLSLSYGIEGSLKSQLGADLLVVGSEELLDVAQPLIEKRRQEGLRVVEAPIQQIYSEFTEGRVSSRAIREFVDYALANYQAPQAQYLLILGDASQDPKNALQASNVSPNTMPIPIERGSYMDFGNDNFHIADTNGIPRISVGRIPTSNPETLQKYVQKILDYENGDRSPMGSALHELRFYVGGDKVNDDFGGYTNSLRDSILINDPRFTAPVYHHYDILDTDSEHVTGSFSNSPFAITYFGHGAENMWSSPDPDSSGQHTLFDKDLASGLTNQRLPFVLALNCWNSRFYGDVDTIAESFLFAEGGAIAFWGSTTTTIPPVQTAMAQSFFAELGKETHQYSHDVRIGELMLRSKLSIAGQGAAKDTLRSWTLFGDPSMKLPESLYVPTPLSPATPGDDDSGVVAAQPPPVEQLPSDPGAITQPAPSSDSGGGGGCGMVVPPKLPGGPKPPGSNALPVLLLLAPLLLLARRRLFLRF